MSAATSAEAMGICNGSPGIDTEEQAVLDAVAMAAEAVLLVTRVTAGDPDDGVSFC